MKTLEMRIFRTSRDLNRSNQQINMITCYWKQLQRVLLTHLRDCYSTCHHLELQRLVLLPVQLLLNSFASELLGKWKLLIKYKITHPLTVDQLIPLAEEL